VHPPWGDVLLPLSACAWVAAFLGFAILYAPLFCRPKRTSAGVVR